MSAHERRPASSLSLDARARQDEVDAGDELLAIVMLAQLCRHLPQKWTRVRIILNPARGHALQPRFAIRSAWKRAGVGGVLAGHTENVVRQR